MFELAKAGETLAEFTAKQAAVYGVEVTDTAIRGVPVSYFRAMETYDGVLYKILNFVFDGGENYMMLRFWLDGDTAADEAMAIIRTIQ